MLNVMNIGDSILPYAFKIHSKEVVSKGRFTSGVKLGQCVTSDFDNLYLLSKYRVTKYVNSNKISVHIEQLWRLNFLTKRWKMLHEFEPPLKEFEGAQLFSFKDNIYVLDQSRYRSHVLYKGNLVTERWDIFNTSGICPPFMLTESVAFVNNKLYIHSGNCNTADSLYRLNLADSAWECIAKCPFIISRCGSVPIAANDDFVFFFMTPVSQCFNWDNFSRIVAFNLKLEKWSSIKTYPDVKATFQPGTSDQGYPSFRESITVKQTNKHIYIIGGSNGKVSFKDIWSFNMRKRKWCRLPCTVPNGKYSLTVAPDHCLYFIHCQKSHIVRIRLAVESLKEMCWQALMHYIPNPLKMSISEWHNLNLPPDLMERIEIELYNYDAWMPGHLMQLSLRV